MTGMRVQFLRASGGRLRVGRDLPEQGSTVVLGLNRSKALRVAVVMERSRAQTPGCESRVAVDMR